MKDSLKIATWNIKGALSDPTRFEKVLSVIERESPDIITLPDTWHEDSEDSTPTDRELLVSEERFEQLGYEALSSTFSDGRPDDNYAMYGFTTLTKLADESIRPGDARVKSTQEYEYSVNFPSAHHVICALGGKTLSVTAMYLSDLSDTARLGQLEPVLDSFKKSPVAMPQLIIGDLNSMHASSMPARILRNRLVRPLLEKIHYQNDTAPRLTRMAQGGVMQAFEAAGFSDLDPHHCPTMPTNLPLFQLDHAMYRDPEDRFTTSIPKVDFYNSLSDHGYVSVTLTTPQPSK